MARDYKMQKRHFQFIADAIRSAGLPAKEHHALAEHFAKCLRVTNPQFDAARFLEACSNANYPRRETRYALRELPNAENSTARAEAAERELAEYKDQSDKDQQEAIASVTLQLCEQRDAARRQSAALREALVGLLEALRVHAVLLPVGSFEAARAALAECEQKGKK